jgi:hypothetical protein
MGTGASPLEDSLRLGQSHFSGTTGRGFADAKVAKFFFVVVEMGTVPSTLGDSLRLGQSPFLLAKTRSAWDSPHFSGFACVEARMRVR